MNTYELRRVAGVVEGLAEDIYPTNVFLPLTDEDKENMWKVHELFPNLLSRVDSAACRRAFNIATKRIIEIAEDVEPF